MFKTFCLFFEFGISYCRVGSMVKIAWTFMVLMYRIDGTVTNIQVPSELLPGSATVGCLLSSLKRAAVGNASEEGESHP